MYLYAVFIGICLGLIVSIAFNVYSRRTADEYSLFLVGENSTTFIKNILVSIVFFLIVVVGWASLLIRDTAFPREHMNRFLVELLLVGLLPALTIFVLYYSRNHPLGKTGWIGFGALAFKCMLAHVLLQLSGVYTSILL